ncbi:peptide chain release factor N(5)-glutamine methyltransferase [Ilumatobacter sp.]|uniref:peptide chain release factor N(5)-glutamine methyltransferase n=1 Tax=Ilumatobacter sp. TaxID=1967498 RepID=UPI003B51C577
MSDPSPVVTWRSLLAETASSVGGRAHARWMCETAASVSSAELDSMLDDHPTHRMVRHLDSMVERARLGEPIQYVLGRWGFRHLDLAVDRRVLIPRPETEAVVEVAVDLASATGPTRVVADLGTGSGAIALALADELPVVGTTVWMTDVSSDALAVAQANLAGLGRAAVNVRIAQGSWCDALPAGVDFDVIVANPPYVADASDELEAIVRDWEPPGALFAGADGLDAIREIVPAAIARLRPGGSCVIEHGHDQGPRVRALMASAGYVEVRTRSDLSGSDRVTSARRPGA